MHKVYPHAPLHNANTYKLLYHAQQRLRSRNFPGLKEKGPTNFIQDNLNNVKYFGRPDTSGLEFWGTENITFLIDTNRHVIRTIYEPQFPLHIMPEGEEESERVKQAKEDLSLTLEKECTRIIKHIWADSAKTLSELGDNYTELSKLYDSASRINRPDQLQEKMEEISAIEDETTTGRWKMEEIDTDITNINRLVDKAKRQLQK